MTAPRQIAFLSGRSDRARWALSPAQREFLRRLASEGDRVIDVNFPYGPTLPFRRVALVRASWHNVREYLACRQTGFARRYGPAVTDLVAAAPSTVFVAGSCGLALFNALRLAAELERRCTLICLGPVALALPRHARALVVQGRRDFVSRALFRIPSTAAVHAPPCDHLGYLRCPQVLQLCQDFLQPVSPCSNISA